MNNYQLDPKLLLRGKGKRLNFAKPKPHGPPRKEIVREIL